MAARFRRPSSHWAFAAALTLALGLAAPRPTRAQRATASIVGRLVAQQSRGPIAGAAITFLGRGRTTASDSQGAFTQDRLPAGTYVMQVHAVGYAAASWLITLGAGEVLTQEFELQPLPVQLDPVTVERAPSFAEQRRQEFERRRASGRGYFITAEAISRAQPRMLADLFRNVPGVRLVCRGTSRCAVRMSRAPQECRPDFIVDGFPATHSTSLEMPVVGVTGIEIYRTLTETPIEFLKSDNVCGTVVIWTRSGP